MLAQDVRVCYETHFVREPVGKQLHNLSPGGATYTSPALPALGQVRRIVQVPEGRPSFVTASRAVGAKSNDRAPAWRKKSSYTNQHRVAKNDLSPADQFRTILEGSRATAVLRQVRALPVVRHGSRSA